MDSYLPLYAEKRCLVCGSWRGQHTDVGDMADNKNMLCPVSDDLKDYYGTQPSFVPGNH